MCQDGKNEHFTHHWLLCEMHLFENRQKLPAYANHPNGHTHACPCVCLYIHKHTCAYTHKHTPVTVTWFTFNPLQDTESSGSLERFIITRSPLCRSHSGSDLRGCTLTLRSRSDHCHWVETLHNGKFSFVILNTPQRLDP